MGLGSFGVARASCVFLLAVRRISASVGGLERRWVRPAPSPPDRLRQIQTISASPDAVKLWRYLITPLRRRFTGAGSADDPPEVRKQVN